MRISTMGRYALRTLIEIVSRPGTGPVSLKSIAEAQRLSANYLWHIVTPMKRKRILKIARGVSGGCLLARPPEEITLLDIVEAVEGPVSLVACVRNSKRCRYAPECIANEVWGEVNEALRGAMARLTLADIVTKSKVKDDAASANLPTDSNVSEVGQA
ncbi:MAG: RrF2 family transcriptional regulator [Kiritimatiellia bacterium]